MGVSVFPSGGGGSSIKSIQRGVASSAGNITISAVDTSKTMVRSFSTGSSGTVSATGNINAASISANVAAHSMSGNASATNVNAWYTGYPGGGTNVNAWQAAGYNWPVGAQSLSGNIAAASIPGNISGSSISGGTTNLTSAEFGIFLVNSTTITATGACRWEVIEFN